MKRTYVDIIGDYYDTQDDLDELAEFGVSNKDLQKISKPQKRKALKIKD